MDAISMSPAQQRLWRAAEPRTTGRGYWSGLVADLIGPLDTGALTGALSVLDARPDMLRTAAAQDHGQPARQPHPPDPSGAALPVLDVAPAEADQRAAAGLTAAADLPGGRLWHAQLHRLGPGHHQLLLALHHLIADDPTLPLLLNDLAAEYNRAVADPSGRPEPQAPPSASCPETGPDVETEPGLRPGTQAGERFSAWLARLDGVPRLELPTDRPRRPPGPRPGALLPLTVPLDVWDALRELARAHRCTPAQVLLTGWAAVLHRFSGQDDFTIGMRVRTRRDPGPSDASGLHVDTVPVWFALPGNPVFTDLLGEVRDQMLMTLAAGAAPLDEVVHRFRDRGGAPLFDVCFGLAGTRRDRLDLRDVKTSVRRLYGGYAKFDLDLQLTDDGPGQPLHGCLEYDRDLFDVGTARALGASFVTLLASVTAEPRTRIGSLGLLPSGSPGSAQDGHAGPDAGPAGTRVDALFAAVARERPGQVALIDAADGRQLTYAGLSARAAAVSAQLAIHGVGPGDFVGLALPRSRDLVVAILGVLGTGAAYVPLDPDHPVGRLQTMVRRTGIRLILGEAPEGLGVPVFTLLGLTRPEPENSPQQQDSGSVANGFEPGDSLEDPAYVMFTSGSTGEPKAVVVPHRAIVRLVRDTDFAAMTPDERWLHAASPSFDASTLELWAALLNGGSLVVMPPMFSLADLGRTLERYRVTSAFLTTGLFNVVVDDEPQALRPLRQIVIGGEAASADHVRRALKVVPVVVNGYGPTENTTFTCAHRVRALPGTATSVPIGTPIQGGTVHLVDDYLNPVPDGMVGELMAGGSGLAQGYLGSPALTAERFVPNPFGPPGSRLYSTGDLARRGPEGLLHFVGRRDDQVKVRGFRIELGGIEHALLTHPGVTQAAVVVHTDPSGDRRLAAYTVGPANAAELIAHLSETLPAYMVPGQWTRLTAMPIGPTGKVDRRALPAPGDEAEPVTHPRTLVEDALMSWYMELLGLDDVSPDTDFFTVGGHSLFASRLVARIRATFGVELPLSAVFTASRLGDLAARVAGNDVPPPGRSEPDPPEDVQEGLQDSIAEVWGRLTGSPVEDGGANFFRIGGHSLTAIQVVAAIREQLGREVALIELFEHPTLADFTERVAASPSAELAPTPARATGPAEAEGGTGRG